MVSGIRAEMAAYSPSTSGSYWRSSVVALAPMTGSTLLPIQEGFLLWGDSEAKEVRFLNEGRPASP